MNEIVEFRAEHPTNMPALGVYAREAALLDVDDQTTYEYADSLLGEYKTRRNGIEAERKKGVDQLNKLKETIQGWFKPVLDDLDEFEKITKGKLLTYRSEQQRLDRERQAIADEAARQERERLRAEAAKAAKAGKVEVAQVLEATAAVMTAPIVTSTFVPTKGTSVRKVWKARVISKIDVIRYVAEHPEYEYLLEVDMSGANSLAKMMEAKLCVTGLEAFEEEILARRAA